MKNYSTKRYFDIDGKKRNIMKGGGTKGKFYYNKKVGNKFEKVNLTKKQVAGFMKDLLNELKIDLETFIEEKKFIDKGVVSDMGAQPLDKDFPDIKYFTFTSSTQVYNKVLKYANNNNKIVLGYRIMHEVNNNEYVLTIEFIDNYDSKSSGSSISSPTSMRSPGSSMGSPWQDAQDPYGLHSNSPQRTTVEQICRKIQTLNETQMSMLEDCLNKM